MLSGLGLLLLHVVAGRRRANNPIYALFALMTRFWRGLLARRMGRDRDSLLVLGVMEIVLALVWLGLGAIKLKFFL